MRGSVSLATCCTRMNAFNETELNETELNETENETELNETELNETGMRPNYTT